MNVRDGSQARDAVFVVLEGLAGESAVVLKISR